MVQEPREVNRGDGFVDVYLGNRGWVTIKSKDAAKNEPKPTQGKIDILPLVLKDLQSRAEMGKEKHGTLLQSHNGRDALMDAYQEALDLVMYLRQLIEERNNNNA